MSFIFSRNLPPDPPGEDDPDNPDGPRPPGPGGGTGSGFNVTTPSPPFSLTVASVPPNSPSPTSFVFKIQPAKEVGIKSGPSVYYRIYYLGNLYAISGVPVYGGLGIALLTKLPRQLVTQIPVTGPYQTVTVASGPYLAGGWFYAVGVGATGIEGIPTAPVVVPILGNLGIPTAEVTAVNAVLAISTINTLNYATATCSWTTTTTAVPSVVGTSFIQIYISNYDNLGLVWEGPLFPVTQIAGLAQTGQFTIECDDGTGGFPGPGAHSVTLYFVSVSSGGVRRSDPTSAPNKVLATGFHS